MRTTSLLLLLVFALGCQDTTAPPPDLVTFEAGEGSETLVEITADIPPVEDGRRLPVIEPRSQWSEVKTAADALGRIGVAAVPDLLAVITDPTEPIELRRQAVDILARIGPPAAEITGTIPALEAALADDDHELRKAAAAALGQMGPGAAAAVPELMQILRTEIEEAQK